MPTAIRYSISETLHEGYGTTLYRGVRAADGRPVVLKVTRPQSHPAELERLQRELAIAGMLDLPTVVKALALDELHGRPALVLEDVGGASLDRILAEHLRAEGRPLPLLRALHLGACIARAVADVHAAKVVHKDLKPANVVVASGDDDVKLTDFGIASVVPVSPDAPRLIEGSLAYMAPEQSGRTGRGIDTRSDLYSLGVILYELLTGRLPFEASDPVEWIHCHVARPPRPPHEVEPGVPAPLSALVMRLLAKLPEERYASAAALACDLSRAAAVLGQTGGLEGFAAGAPETALRFEVPRRLYGREEERAALTGALDQVRGGASATVLVSGYSGIGKSALLEELRGPARRAGGLFGGGKFDQYKRGIPYAAVVESFGQLADELLSRSEDELRAWQRRLSAALGVNARLVTDLVPGFERILGPLAPVVELSGEGARARFDHTMKQLVRALAEPGRPLVIALDDLQWGDAASLDLLGHLAASALPNVLLLGAYREHELSASPELTRVLPALRTAGAREIVPAPLRAADLEHLVTDALHCPTAHAEAVAAVLADKTGGNPFFVVQLLTGLHRVSLLRREGDAWRVDLPRIAELGYAEDVARLMAQKLERLSPETRDALLLAACAGTAVDTAVLSAVLGTPEADVARELEPAVREGLVSITGSVVRFAHDRVQQAAYATPTEGGRRERVHLQLGRLLSENRPAEEVERRVFDVVNQLNAAEALLVSAADRASLVRLNLLAGRRARGQAAYAAAAKYLAAAARALAPSCWEQEHETAFAVNLERAEAEYLAGSFATAESLLEQLKARARDRVEHAEIHRVEVDAVLTKGDIPRAVEAALAGLRLFGIDMTPHPTVEEVRVVDEAIARNMRGRAIEDLIGLPPMTDRDMTAAMRLLAVLMAPAFFTDNNLFFLHLGHMVDISLRYGNTDASVSGYGWFGVGLTVLFRRYEEGYRFGKLGYDLMRRRGAAVYEATANMVMEMLSFWNRPGDEMVDFARASFEAAERTGNRPIAGYACNHLVMDLLHRGVPLDEVLRESEERLAWVRAASYQDICDILVSIQRYVENMRGTTESFSSFRGPGYDEAAFEAGLTEGRMPTLLCWHDLMTLMARFMSGDYELAVQAGDRADKRLWSSLGLPQYYEFHLYFALACASHYADAGPDQQERYRGVLESHRATLEEWAENCRGSFLPGYALVSAEEQRIRGDVVGAMDLYETAIRAARDGRYVHLEGIAYELAARFYRGRGLETFGDAYLREARTCYARWGAAGKVRQLERSFPQLQERPLAAAGVALRDGRAGVDPGATFAARAEQLDLLSVIKASQTISGEIVLSKLVCRLLEVVVAQGGAQRGVLALALGGELRAYAEAKVGERAVEARLVPSTPLLASARVPASMVHYAKRTGERVMIDASRDDHRFADDPYFETARPRSLVCLPIVRQAEAIGVLVLENDLAPGAFAPDRLALLELLASQAAISLENALFVAHEEAARATAEEAERRAALLAEASAMLGESLDDERLGARVCRLLTRLPANACVVELAQSDLGGRQRVGAHEDPARQVVLEELMERYPLGPEGHTVPVVWHPTGINEDHTRLLAAVGASTALSAHLVARGRTVGTLRFFRDEARPTFDAAEQALVRELAHRVAIAVDNARLFHLTQNAVRMRDDFLSVASHELRTPMTSLRLSLTTLQRAVRQDPSLSADTSARLLEVTQRQVDRLERLIDDLMDVTRIDQGQLVLERSELDLGSLVASVVARLEPDLQRAGCPVSLAAVHAVRGSWDRSRLDQVLTNLLSNALKFGAGHPVEIGLEEVPNPRGRWATLTVTDHGIGIAASRTPHVFDRFERAVSAQHYGGLGLGLFITRRIVQAHGGAIAVESRLGEGTTFRVDLPCDGPPLEVRG